MESYFTPSANQHDSLSHLRPVVTAPPIRQAFGGQRMTRVVAQADFGFTRIQMA